MPTDSSTPAAIIQAQTFLAGRMVNAIAASMLAVVREKDETAYKQIIAALILGEMPQMQRESHADGHFVGVLKVQLGDIEVKFSLLGQEPDDDTPDRLVSPYVIITRNDAFTVIEVIDDLPHFRVEVTPQLRGLLLPPADA